MKRSLTAILFAGFLAITACASEKEMGTVACSKEKPDAVSYTAGNSRLELTISDGIENYSGKVTGGRLVLKASTFICEPDIKPIIDEKYGQIIAAGRDDKFFPAKYAFLNIKTGKEEAAFWHPGHLNSLALAYETGDGSDYIIFTASSNISQLIGMAEAQTGRTPPYLPAIGVLKRQGNGVEIAAYYLPILEKGRADIKNVSGQTITFQLETPSGTRDDEISVSKLLGDGKANAEQYKALFTQN